MSNIINLSGNLNDLNEENILEISKLDPENNVITENHINIYTMPFNKINKNNITQTMNISIKPIHFSLNYVNCKFFNNNLMKLIYKSPSIFLNGIYFNLNIDLITHACIFTDITNIINGKLYLLLKNPNIEQMEILNLFIEINQLLRQKAYDKIIENNNENISKKKKYTTKNPVNLDINSNNMDSLVDNNNDHDSGTILKEIIEMQSSNDPLLTKKLLEMFNKFKLPVNIVIDNKFEHNILTNYYDDFVELIEVSDDKYYLVKFNEVNNNIIKEILNYKKYLDSKVSNYEFDLEPKESNLEFNSHNLNNLDNIEDNLKLVFRITEMKFNPYKNNYNVITCLNYKFL